jgi:hypothetical protein
LFYHIGHPRRTPANDKHVIEKHYLRRADSIHLSSALWLKDTINEEIAFVASDINLLNAASSEGLGIINPVV